MQMKPLRDSIFAAALCMIAGFNIAVAIGAGTFFHWLLAIGLTSLAIGGEILVVFGGIAIGYDAGYKDRAQGRMAEIAVGGRQ